MISGSAFLCTQLQLNFICSLLQPFSCWLQVAVCRHENDPQHPTSALASTTMFFALSDLLPKSMAEPVKFKPNALDLPAITGQPMYGSGVPWAEYRSK